MAGSVGWSVTRRRRAWVCVRRQLVRGLHGSSLGDGRNGSAGTERKLPVLTAHQLGTVCCCQPAEEAR